MSERLISYVLCYTVRFTNRMGRKREKDHFIVFCEEDENGKPPIEQAEAKLVELEKQYEKYERTELYSWNIAKIFKTTEHYNIG